MLIGTSLGGARPKAVVEHGQDLMEDSYRRHRMVSALTLLQSDADCEAISPAFLYEGFFYEDA